MLDGNTPAEGTALSPDEGKRKVAALLGTPPQEQAKPAERETPVEAQQPQSPEPDDVNVSDEGGDDETPSHDDTESDPVRYRLPDGTEATADEVSEWRKGYLRQSDYTRKMQAEATRRKEVEARDAELVQRAKQYDQFDQTLSFAIQVAEAKLPPKPDMDRMPLKADYPNDLVGYLTDLAEFNEGVNQYNSSVGELQQLYTAKQQAQEASEYERQNANKEYLAIQRDALLNAMPELKDKEKLNKFQSKLSTGVEKYYGGTAGELAMVQDARLIRIISDAVDYRMLLASKPQAIDKAKDAAPVQQPGKRLAPGEAQAKARQEQMAKLRKTGDRNIGQSLIRGLLDRGG